MNFCCWRQQVRWRHAVWDVWKVTTLGIWNSWICVRKDELESGRRAKRVYLRQNILDKYGRTAGSPGCDGNGQHTEECRARIEQKWWTKMMQLSPRHLEIRKKLCQNLMSVFKRKAPDINPGGASSLTADTPKRGEWELPCVAALRLLTNCFVTRHLSTSAEIGMHGVESPRRWIESRPRIWAAKHVEFRSFRRISIGGWVASRKTRLWHGVCWWMARWPSEVTTLCASAQGRGAPGRLVCGNARHVFFLLHSCTLEQMRQFIWRCLQVSRVQYFGDSRQQWTQPEKLQSTGKSSHATSAFPTERKQSVYSQTV